MRPWMLMAITPTWAFNIFHSVNHRTLTRLAVLKPALRRQHITSSIQMPTVPINLVYVFACAHLELVSNPASGLF